MNDVIGYLPQGVWLGVLATAFMDVAMAARTRIFGTPTLDYALVGRWCGHLLGGRFRHSPISASPAIRAERVVGWAFHYVTGVIFAFVLLAVWGADWICNPTLQPAIVVGIGSIAAPFLIMQPGMGSGIAARLTPHPWRARFRSLVTHAIFAMGLYVAGLLTSNLHVFECGG